jgi:hypothetical protein
MPDELEHLLRLVAEGRLTPDEAAPLIEALAAHEAEDDLDDEAPELDELSAGLRHARGELQRAAREARRGARESVRVARRAAREASREARASLRDALRGRHLRIRVTERGHQVVNLRIPLAFAGSAIDMVPGLGAEYAERIRQAIDAREIGPIVDIEDPDGGGVLISVE